MMRAFSLGLFLLLGGCDRTAASSDGNAAAPVPAPDRLAGSTKVLKSETVEAVFTGWDKGDYAWARLKVKGREEFGAWSGPSPIDLFLDAHVGKPLTVRLDTIMADVPEARGKLEVQRIAGARMGELTAEAWWNALTPKQRQDAQISLAGSLEPLPPPIEP